MGAKPNVPNIAKGNVGSNAPKTIPHQPGKTLAQAIANANAAARQGNSQ
jgi:hypothetical protein